MNIEFRGRYDKNIIPRCDLFPYRFEGQKGCLSTLQTETVMSRGKVDCFIAVVIVLLERVEQVGSWISLLEDCF